MSKAVFLDRDGIINIERGEYTFRKEDFAWVPGIIEAVKILHKKGFLVVVITNQSGIAKGIYTHQDVAERHAQVMETLSPKGEISGIFYCPHHPDHSKCICRKPDSALIEKAMARFSIDPSISLFIGDKPRDVEAAEKAGVKGILVEANSSIVDFVKLL